MADVQDTLRRWREAMAVKSEWHEHYDDLARVMLPRRIGFNTTTIEGERRTDDIFDGTPMQAARGLANAIGGMLRPEGRSFFEMGVGDDRLEGLGEVQDWLADSEEQVHKALNNPKARFRQATGESDQDLVVFGTAIMGIMESVNRQHLAFSSVHLKDGTPLFNEDGSPEGLFRKRKIPVRHAFERFGDKLSPESMDLLKNKPDDKIELLHAVIPRKDGRNDALLARNLPIADLWIEIEAAKELTSGGSMSSPS